MMKIDGKDYKTISDAAAWFHVSVRTLRQWIDNGIIPQPPKMYHGLREIEVFTDEYLEEAKRVLDAYKEKKKLERKSKHRGHAPVSKPIQIDPSNQDNL
jgi:hypothetical protein